MATVLPISAERFNSPIQYIDPSTLRPERRRLDKGLLQPALNEIEADVVEDHGSEPIKRLADINRMSEYFIQNGQYRDNMLFIVGINFGLRVSDLSRLRFCDLIDSDGTFKDVFPVFEIKTRNTRKVKRNRYIYINSAVMDAVTLYLQHTPRRLDDYMFYCEGNRGKNSGKPLTRQSIDRILKKAAVDLDLPYKVTTHSLRRTFGYHQMVMSNNDPRKLLLLQQIFGHSSVNETMRYIGLTGEEIREAYQTLNLGGDVQRSLIDSTIGEGDTVTVS